MSELRIIPVVFGGKHFIITDHRMQYDYGQVLDFKDLELPDSFEARFSNSPVGESVGQIGTNNRIRIPKQFFESGEPIYCYITLHDEVTDGRTVYTTKVPIKPSTERTEEEPEPEEESIITQAITALNNAVDVTSQKAQEASESADRAEQAADGIEAYVERAEAAQSASESARDIALEAKVSAQASASASAQSASQSAQIKSDVEDLVDDAQASASASAQSATASANSASQASASATSASQSATSAQGYASQAQTSANTASSKASEASQSASTASAKATESAQSASQALTYKTDAESAKTSAETAQGLAESARDDAITAKTSAESARDEAQDIVDGITGKVEQIDSNTDRIESLEDDRYKPYAVDTASGSIASFPDGADGIPLKSCIVQVEPVQDLHGYDHPWPAGGGVNTLDPESLIEQYPSPAYDLAIARSGEWLTINGTYSSEIQSPQFRFMKKKDDFTFDDTYWAFPDSNSSNNIPGWINRADSNKTLTIGLQNMIQGNTYNLRFRLMGVTDTTRPTDYAPYENICPISGWTGCNVSHSGADMSDPTLHPITFPTEAGTVYGGLLDMTKGELVVDRASVDMGTLRWTYLNDVEELQVHITMREIAKNNQKANILCSVYQVLPYLNIADKSIAQTSGTNPRIRVKDSAYTDAVAFKTAMSGVQLVYELATPITYHFTPQEIKTLYGQNNLWANTGDTEVEYRADVTKYISKKITEAVSALT